MHDEMRRTKDVKETHVQFHHHSAKEATQRPKDRKQLTEKRILVSLWSSMKNVVNLKLIEISKNFQGRFTAKCGKLLSCH